MYLIIVVLFGLLMYVSFVAYAKEFKLKYSYFQMGFRAWKSLSKEDFKVLAKDATKSPLSLRSMYLNGSDIIFYPIVGIIYGLGCIVRDSHVSAVDSI